MFTTYLSWRLVFFVNLPFGVAAFVFGAVALAGHTTDHPGRLDLAGLLLSRLGLGSLMYGISAGPDQGWTAAPVLTALSAGVLLLVALVFVELRLARPLIDLRLFGNRLFSAGTGLYGLGSVAYLGTLFLAALFLQNVFGLSAVQTGLTIFPSALGTMAGGQLVTRVLYWRFGPRRIAAAGLLAVAAMTVLLAQTGPGTNLWLVRVVVFGLGLGISFVFIPAQAASMATVSKARTGRASALFNAAKQLGGAAGVALLTTVLAIAGPTGGINTTVSAYHAGFLAAAATALLGVGIALTVRDADAAATMVSPATKQAKEPATR